MIKLTKPIVFFDLETTGVSTGTDKIVQIAITKVFPDGQVVHKERLINPANSNSTPVCQLKNSCTREDETACRRDKWDKFILFFWMEGRGTRLPGHHQHKGAMRPFDDYAKTL